MDGLLADTPALARLRWRLAGLDDRWSPAADVAAALTPQFAHAVTPAAVLAVTRERAQRLAPIRVVGVDTGSQAATARFLSRDDEPWVAHVEVAGAAPHRITTMYAQPAVPDHLTPSLPLDFTGLPMPSTPGSALVVVSGVPGSGKSTVAEGLGAALGIPTFALDWLLGRTDPVRHAAP